MQALVPSVAVAHWRTGNQRWLLHNNSRSLSTSANCDFGSKPRNFSDFLLTVPIFISMLFSLWVQRCCISPNLRKQSTIFPSDNDQLNFLNCRYIKMFIVLYDKQWALMHCAVKYCQINFSINVLAFRIPNSSFAYTLRKRIVLKAYAQFGSCSVCCRPSQKTL